jgi:hypothetical protein
VFFSLFCFFSLFVALSFSMCIYVYLFISFLESNKGEFLYLLLLPLLSILFLPYSNTYSDYALLSFLFFISLFKKTSFNVL